MNSSCPLPVMLRGSSYRPQASQGLPAASTSISHTGARWKTTQGHRSRHTAGDPQERRAVIVFLCLCLVTHHTPPPPISPSSSSFFAPLRATCPPRDWLTNGEDAPAASCHRVFFHMMDVCRALLSLRPWLGRKKNTRNHWKCLTFSVVDLERGRAKKFHMWPGVGVGSRALLLLLLCFLSWKTTRDGDEKCVFFFVVR